MANTFAGSTLTNNGSFNPSSDHKTPALGSLNLSAMPTTTALAGTTGTDAKLIHGDRQQIYNNETDFITQNYNRAHAAEEQEQQSTAPSREHYK